MGIHNHTIIALFLAVEVSTAGEVENWGSCLVVLGCNVTTLVVDPSGC